VDVAAFQKRLAATLPAGIAVLRPETSLAAGASLSRSYRVNLAVLALVALFTGGLLVFSTQALSVVRRRPQFALLRVLGMTQRRLSMLVVAEGALVGGMGGLIGVAAGYALARVAVQVVGADLGSGYFRDIAPALTPDPTVLAGFLAFGVLAEALGSFAPAFEAARAAPARRGWRRGRALARLRSRYQRRYARSGRRDVASRSPVAVRYLAVRCCSSALMLMPRIAVALLALPAPPAAAGAGAGTTARPARRP
jgi:putative ABC transport system permease protein